MVLLHSMLVSSSAGFDEEIHSWPAVMSLYLDTKEKVAAATKKSKLPGTKK